MSLGTAQLAVTAPSAVRSAKWGNWLAPFDVVCYVTISVAGPPNRMGYRGRSHSLYYCDALEEGAYNWFETAFSPGFLLAHTSAMAPYALSAGSEDAAIALSRAVGAHQVAWPFTPLVSGDLDAFIDRWLSWFAAASKGELGYPSPLPEAPVPRAWRVEEQPGR